MLTVQEKAGEEKTPCCKTFLRFGLIFFSSQQWCVCVCVCVQVLTENEFSPRSFDYICIKLVECVVGSELYISLPVYPIFLLVYA